MNTREHILQESYRKGFEKGTLEKHASKWSALLRAGKLSSKSVARLADMLKDPAYKHFQRPGLGRGPMPGSTRAAQRMLRLRDTALSPHRPIMGLEHSLETGRLDPRMWNRLSRSSGGVTSPRPHIGGAYPALSTRTPNMPVLRYVTPTRVPIDMAERVGGAGRLRDLAVSAMQRGQKNPLIGRLLVGRNPWAAEYGNVFAAYHPGKNQIMSNTRPGLGSLVFRHEIAHALREQQRRAGDPRFIASLRKELGRLNNVAGAEVNAYAAHRGKDGTRKLLTELDHYRAAVGSSPNALKVRNATAKNWQSPAASAALEKFNDPAMKSTVEHLQRNYKLSGGKYNKHWLGV